ncbi:MAG: hypothetical protein K5668_00580 [Lachnospiraceae bacterium]|nr:hypothetical protein [Lachnospiraceae bacterium]
MKKKVIIILFGIMICIAACGSQQTAQAPEQQATEAAQKEVAETAVESEAAAEAEAVDQTDEAEEQPNYVEDMVLSTDLITVTVPEEFKGKFLAVVDGESIDFYDKASNESGFGGHAFSVVVDKDKDIMPGGMYKKVGELATSQGERYDVCKGYPSDVQWDYTASDQMPDDYSKLYNSADLFIENAKAVGDGNFMYGAGTKGEDLYPYTVSRYIDAINEGWDVNKYEEENMSPEFYALVKTEGDKALDEIGYIYKDISGDGVDELIVGIIGDSSEPSVVYDIYTMVDGAPTSVASGTARNRYYALEYSGIANVRSEGAGAEAIMVYEIMPGESELLHQYSIKCDTYADEKEPWFVNYDDNDTSWEKMTEEDYRERYEAVNSSFLKLDYIPFSEIVPIDYSKVDLSKYATFTKMLDDFKKGMGYANIKLGDTDVFLVSSGTYNADENVKGAIDASIFMYNDKGEIVYLGNVSSGGTAYPLMIADGCLFTGGHHYVDKTTVKDGKLVTVENASETFDTDGNATYYYGSEKTEDDKELTRLFDEYFKGETVEFSVEKP